ncbi:hypothetical protein SISSUDRAFT_989137 [Sistotremastrum suecicum HHB10207 ss-3]|uniref:Cleavage/polyadenylation specificity factor A subunit C-terminal domain-containing protein n=1 Tax=Sistotremastrum suecicum HHB10207 ss-3 TaxID=1314776 RepID=A0A166BKG8_9AGAM|nr:hypothetical protein SISSUDRAFT_989137 [Sistotremastrum suecicum HHB10207 ss-3]
MRALRQEIISPSGVEYATRLNLTPSTRHPQSVSSSSTSKESRVISNLVVARSNVLRIYEVREEPAPLPSYEEAAQRMQARPMGSHKDTEAVEGEVQMDGEGEGFSSANIVAPTVTRFRFLREHHVHGIVTGMDRISFGETELDKLLISFKDAKIALMEWSEATHDISTISIHTYERSPQMLSPDAPRHTTLLRVDPASRCAALLLPHDALAILPFNQSQDLIPYSPSFVLDLHDISHEIRNIIDFVFLPGLIHPTLAILFQTQQTWTGRLKEYKDTTRLWRISMDLSSQTYPIVSRIENLPYDAFSLLSISPSSGDGLLILASNSIVFVDQQSHAALIPANGWATRVTELPVASFATSNVLTIPQAGLDAGGDALMNGEIPHVLELEGSKVEFVDDNTAFVVTSEGVIYPLEFQKDGGRVASKVVFGAPIARTAAPSVLVRIGENHLFLGSTTGPSPLIKIVKVEEEVVPEVSKANGLENGDNVVVEKEAAMDLDDGEMHPSTVADKPQLNGTTNGVHIETRWTIRLAYCDTLPGHGPITDMTFILNQYGDRNVAELMTSTGVGRTGGFTLYQNFLPTRVKRKMHAIGGSKGIWHIPLRQAPKFNGVATNGNHGVIISTDATPTPGLSRVASRSARNDPIIMNRTTKATVGAASFFQGTAIVQVLIDSIRVLSPDGSERQNIKDMDGNNVRPKIRACHISDPFILIIREDDTLGLFIGEAERGKIRRKDMSTMGDKSSRYIAGSFFTDKTGMFSVLSAQSGEPVQLNGKEKTAGTSSIEAATDTDRGTQWLLLCRPQGVMEIWALPKLTLVFSTPIISTLQSILADSFDIAAPSPPQDPPRQAQEIDIEQVVLTSLGESDQRPHLCILLRNGYLAIYEVVPIPASALRDMPSRHRDTCVPIQFSKMRTYALGSRTLNGTEKRAAPSVVEAIRKPSRILHPFKTTPRLSNGEPGSVTYHGVFLTGDIPLWILATETTAIRIHPCGNNVVHAFSTCPLWGSQGDFLLYTDEGPVLLEWMPEFDIGTELPSRFVPQGKAYSHLSYDVQSSLVVAVASLKTRFQMFDEEAKAIWEPEEPTVSDPTQECSALELISPDGWYTLDGYEFAWNEFVNALETVTLETLSTEAGEKEFIAVGTTLYRGEDLAVKGATYIFEIVQVVGDTEPPHDRRFKLKLLCRDEAKGPVTALCGINGYLVSSMGQKIFVRAFELDERLVGVAFLDVGVYVTSLRSLKNLLLIGDAVRSVWLVAFQEDPFKLAVLAKDLGAVCTMTADFIFGDEEMGIVTSDEEGVLRIYAYDPSDLESRSGMYLMCRSEFHGQSETPRCITVARRTKELDMITPQSRLIYCGTDGSISSLTPVEAEGFQRLQLLQGQLTRNVQHVAGLNPKALRTVRNEGRSKPLTRGIVDGGLVMGSFWELPLARQAEMTRQIGTDARTIVEDLCGLEGSW